MDQGAVDADLLVGDTLIVLDERVITASVRMRDRVAPDKPDDSRVVLELAAPLLVGVEAILGDTSARVLPIGAALVELAPARGQVGSFLPGVILWHVRKRHLALAEP